MIDSEIEFPSFPPAAEGYLSYYLYDKWHLG